MWNNVESYRSSDMTKKGISLGYIMFIANAIILLFVSPCLSSISDKRLCFDPKCSVVVSTGKTLLKYSAKDVGMLSFDVNKDVRIYSKHAGQRQDLWGVEIDGKRGYVPKSLIREKRVIKRDLVHEVPTESSAPEVQSPVDNNIDVDAKLISAETSENTETPEEVKFEVIDGTTMNFLPKEQSADEGYSTRILQSVPPMEQPTLTAHPHLAPSETLEDSTPKVESPSGINKESSSDSPRSVIEELPAKSTSIVDKPQPTVTHKSPVSSENVEPIETDTLPLIETKETDANEQIKAPVEAPVMTEEIATDTNTSIVIPNDESASVTDSKVSIEVETPNNIEEPSHNAQKYETASEAPPVIDDQLQLEQNKSVENTPQIRQDQIIDGTPQVVEEAFNLTESEILDQVASEAVQNTPEIIQSLDQEPTVEIEDKTSEITQHIETPSSETKEVDAVPQSNILANAFGKVASLFDVLSTTEAPSPPKDSEETTTPADVVQPPESTESSIQEDIGSTEAPTEEITKETNYNEPSNITDSDDNNNSTAEASEENNSTLGQPGIYQKDELTDPDQNIVIDQASNFNEFPANRNLLNVGSIAQDAEKVDILTNISISQVAEKIVNLSEKVEDVPTLIPEATEAPEEKYDYETDEAGVKHVILPPEACHIDNSCDETESSYEKDETAVINAFLSGQNYWETLSYLTLTAVTTLFFSLGYYYIENTRRDGQLIAKINKLEKELLISSKECSVLDETLKSTKTKLNSIEDESYGSTETVASLKEDLEAANTSKHDLEDQVAVLEKDLESATEAGLELERMLREILASKNAENPLTKSVEDLRARLAAQLSTNESLTNTLHLKIQEHEFDKAENETLSSELAATTQKCEQFEVEILRITEELNMVQNERDSLIKSSSLQIEQIEKQLKDLSAEKINLRKQLKGKEMEMNDLLDVVKQANINNLDLDKLSNVSKIKAESSQLMEERDELKMKLNELEGAHHLLEEHMKIINEEISSIREQCKFAEKEKDDAVTRLQVLSKFFQEKEEERKKEETIWLQQQGEVSTTTEKLQAMQNEIQNYRQQIEELKREILDQEREYKSQMTNLETKAHEQWVLARQSERRLEESKAEAGVLRNRLTLIEKNLTEPDSDVKNHRLEANGETPTSPQLFIGAEASSSPIMFSGSSNMPPPYLPYGMGGPLPYLPPHLTPSGGFDVSQRPPPLGGRLPSPPPIPPPAPVLSRYDSPPPPFPMSPSMLPPFGHHYRTHPPPPLPFHNDRIPPPPMPLLPPGPLPNPPWDDKLSSSRNNGSFHPFRRDQRSRDYKGSLESSAESLDKTHHSGKV